MLHPIDPITGRRIRIALVGCGRISRNHIKAIASHQERAELVALCDTQPERLVQAQLLVAEAAHEHPGAASRPAQFSTYTELLAATQAGTTPVDLVVLATPSGLHPGQVIAAAEAGLHVCTEKPMATRWADGVAMVKACDEAGVRLFVVKQNRFNSTLQLVRRQLQAGRFGQLAMVAVNVFWQRPQSYYDQDSWRGTWEFDGGALMNQSSHYIDLLDWLVGPVQSVSASIATLGRAIEVEDTAALQLRWRNGALGTMAVTMLTYPKNMEGSITLLGETGSVKIGGPAVNQIEHWAFADESPDDALVEQASYETTSVYGFGHPPYYANVLDALQSEAEALCDGREGLRSLELLIGAYRSARDGRTVHLPLEYRPLICNFSSQNLPPKLQCLTARGRALAQRLKPQSTSSRNVLKLAGGTAGSQVIAVAAAPILTRLYGPESFGVLATFASILALLNVVSSLRYELAIAVPEDDDEAVALVWLCFGLVSISTGLMALGLLLLGDQLVAWLNEPALKPLVWLLPVGVLLTGVYQPLTYWVIRRKQFGLLAQTKFRQSIFGVATNLAAAPLGTIGLLVGQIVSQSAGFVSILRQSATQLLRPVITPAVLGQLLRRYSHFGIYSSPAGLINTIGNQAPTLIFALVFGAAQLGQLALAQRLLLLPAGLIGSSVGQVFLSQAADRYRAGKLPALIRKASRKLLLYGVIVAAFACMGLAPLMPLIFGQEWEPTRWIIPLLVPLFLGQLVVSPLSMVFVAAQQNQAGLVAQTTLMAVRLSPLAATLLIHDPSFIATIASYSLASLLGYSLYFLMLIKASSGSCSSGS